MQIEHEFISIIIPTHNRGEILLQVLECLLALRSETPFEIIVVDNNSTDDTRKSIKEIEAQWPNFVQYAFEEKRSAAAARNTGAKLAKGDILAFLDDDVFVQPGSFRRMIEIFRDFARCGVVAGQVTPKYECDPPAWSLRCSREVNGWSLQYPERAPYLASGFQEIVFAVGAMLTLRRSAFEAIGEYPDDIVMIETAPHSNKYFRLDIGAGDAGIASLVRARGYKIYYDPQIVCSHLVSRNRMTPHFWRARMISEATYHSITKRIFWRHSILDLRLLRFQNITKMVKTIQQTTERLASDSIPPGSIIPEELWLYYYKTVLELDYILLRHPELCDYLREISGGGIPKGEDAMSKFPADFRAFVTEYLVNDTSGITNAEELKLFRNKLPDEIVVQCNTLAATADLMRNRYSTLLQRDPYDLLTDDRLQSDCILLLDHLVQSGLADGEVRKWLAFLQIKHGKLEAAVSNLHIAINQNPADIELRAVYAACTAA